MLLIMMKSFNFQKLLKDSSLHLNKRETDRSVYMLDHKTSDL